MTPRAFYNDVDEKACAWTRQLMADGLIMPGDVDCRPIQEIKPDEIRHYTRVHLFCGIAGWDRALQLAGWPIDRRIITASCPCQPFSCAGKSQGVLDERHVWPIVRNLLSECDFADVAGEQVASKDGRLWLSGIRSDMEALGFAFGAADLCAAGVGSPNIRQRLYWMAHAISRGRAARSHAESRPEGRTAFFDQRGTASAACGLAEGDGSASAISGMGHAALPQETRQQRIAEHLSGQKCDAISSGMGNPQSHDQCGQRQSGEVSGRHGEAGGSGSGMLWVEHATGDGREQRRAESSGRGTASGCADGSGLVLAHGTGPFTGRDATTTDGHRSPAQPTGGVGFWDRYVWIPCRDGKLRRVGMAESKSERNRAERNGDTSGRGGYSDGSTDSPATEGQIEFPILSLVDGLSGSLDDGSGESLDARQAIQTQGLIWPLAQKEDRRVMKLKGYGNAINAVLAAEFIRAYLDTEV